MRKCESKWATYGKEKEGQQDLILNSRRVKQFLEKAKTIGLPNTIEYDKTPGWNLMDLITAYTCPKRILWVINVPTVLKYLMMAACSVWI